MEKRDPCDLICLFVLQLILKEKMFDFKISISLYGQKSIVLMFWTSIAFYLPIEMVTPFPPEIWRPLGRPQPRLLLLTVI